MFFGDVFDPVVNTSVGDLAFLIMAFTASLLIVGNDPGCARQIGHTLTLGVVSSGLFKHPQNILVLVLSSA